MYLATVRNETSRDIEILWNSENVAPLSVEPNSMVEMPWAAICLTVIEASGSRVFQVPEELPKGARRSGRFDAEITFVIVYSDDGLHFETLSGELVPIASVLTCDAS